MCKAQNPIAQVTKPVAELNKAGYKAGRRNLSFSKISTRRKDSCFLLFSEEVAVVLEQRPEGKYVCDVFKLCHLESFFTKPCDSKLIRIVYFRNLKDGVRRRIIEKKSLKRKMICLPHRGGYVAFPMLHDIE